MLHIAMIQTWEIFAILNPSHLGEAKGHLIQERATPKANLPSTKHPG
jgi:hypothetical protein